MSLGWNGLRLLSIRSAELFRGAECLGLPVQRRSLRAMGGGHQRTPFPLQGAHARPHFRAPSGMLSFACFRINLC